MTISHLGKKLPSDLVRIERLKENARVQSESSVDSLQAWPEMKEYVIPDQPEMILLLFQAILLLALFNDCVVIKQIK